MRKIYFLNCLLLIILVACCLTSCQKGISVCFQNNPPQQDLFPEESQAIPDQISVGSYNLFLRSKVLNLKQENEARGKKIGAWIKAQNLDIIALQETWDSQAMQHLMNQIKPTLPYYTINQPVKQKSSLLNGGLSIFSKYPILNYQFVVYQDCHGTDCLAAKGFIYVLLDLGNQQKLHFINTHLDAGEKSKDIKARSIQIQQIQTFINALNIQTEPILVAGDFNINRLGHSTEFQELLTILDLEEYSVEKPSTLNCDHTSVTCQDALIQKQLDFIFKVKNEKNISRMATHHYDLTTKEASSNTHYLSDHKAVVATFCINRENVVAAFEE